jgi:hypothetical protein
MAMDVKNLLGKLHAHEGGETEAAAPKVPTPPVPKAPIHVVTPVAMHTAPMTAPVIEERIIQHVHHPTSGGTKTMADDFEGIILDLGEGISLNIPIQRRMSLTDFIKLAEKVKALEMLSESSEMYRKGQY